MTSYTDSEISTYFNKCKDILDKVKLKWINNNNEIEIIDSSKIIIYKENIHLYKEGNITFLIDKENEAKIPYQYCLLNDFKHIKDNIFGFINTSLYKPYKDYNINYIGDHYGYNDFYFKYIKHNPIHTVISMLLNCIEFDTKYKELQLLYNDKVILKIENILKCIDEDNPEEYLYYSYNVFKCYYYEDDKLIKTFNIFNYKDYFEKCILPSSNTSENYVWLSSNKKEDKEKTFNNVLRTNSQNYIETGSWLIPNNPLGTQVFYNIITNI